MRSQALLSGCSRKQQTETQPRIKPYKGNIANDRVVRMVIIMYKSFSS